MSDIEAKVKEIICDKLSVDEAEVTNEASFANDLGADSLAVATACQRLLLRSAFTRGVLSLSSERHPCSFLGPLA